MKIEALERLIVDTLRTEMASHKTAVGQTGEWIYIDFPRMKAKMPRISLTLSSSIQSPRGIGAYVDIPNTLGVLEITSFAIDVWVHRTNKTTGLTPKRGGTSLRDYLVDEIIDILLKKRVTFATNYDINDVEITGQIPHPFDEDMEIFRKTITFQVTHLRIFPDS